MAKTLHFALCILTALVAKTPPFLAVLRRAATAALSGAFGEQQRSMHVLRLCTHTHTHTLLTLLTSSHTHTLTRPIVRLYLLPVLPFVLPSVPISVLPFARCRCADRLSHLPAPSSLPLRCPCAPAAFLLKTGAFCVWCCVVRARDTAFHGRFADRIRDPHVAGRQWLLTVEPLPAAGSFSNLVRLPTHRHNCSCRSSAAAPTAAAM